MKTSGRGRSKFAGNLKLNGPTLFGPRILTPIITDFLARYPDVTVTLTLSDSFVDPAELGADLTIRIGESPSSSLIVRRLGEIRRIVVASPVYLQARGRPQRPSELADHECIVRRGDREAARWVFATDEDEVAVEVKGRFETNSVPAEIEAAVRGQGISMVAYWQVRELLEEGSLEVILREARLKSRPLVALWAPGRLAARARLFLEFLANRLSAQAF